MITARSGSASSTQALGEAMAALLLPGDVVLLVGPLGSGKTTFVQGLARGIGYKGSVTSPTFTLRHTYSGRLDLVHVDLWRLDHIGEVLDLALDEELESGAAVVAEWGEGAEVLLGDGALVVRLEPSATKGERAFEIETRGPWIARERARATALGGATL
ncbi:MAG: tRNA (adenosine(37)-N6)-threonylcarbamoyltransferase complex ATPase subunit type 1 TsaE [Acidimicrobiales bacterium]